MSRMKGKAIMQSVFPILVFLTTICLANNSFAMTTQILYVNQAHPQASDQNPGSQDKPFKTIAKAARVAKTNSENQIGTKILISVGTYREQLTLYEDDSQDAQAPISLEGVGSVIVSGSDIWSGWQRVAGTNIFVHAWPYAWGRAAIPDGWDDITVQDIVRRSEMVFVNRTALQQVLSYGQLKTNSFYVDENAGKVYIQIPGTLSINNALVEVSIRSRLLSVSGKSNLTLKGIIFQHARPTFEKLAVLVEDSSNILIENCKFLWNNWGGLGIQRSQNVTARKNVANYNGGVGIDTTETKALVFEDNETSFNNWRGKQGGFIDWSPAGMKNMHTHGGTFLRHKAVENAATGIWFDTDCENILVEQGTFCSNLLNGIVVEANQGPITIKKSKACNNNQDGITLANSAKVNLENNIMYGNTRSQIRISGEDETRTVTDWETGWDRDLLSEQSSWKHNAIVGNQANQDLVATTLSDTWEHFVNTLSSDNNIYFNSQNSKSFQLDGDRISMTTWKSRTGQDRNSLFTDPLFRDPAKGDFSLLPGSPLLAMPGWGPSLSPVGKLIADE